MSCRKTIFSVCILFTLLSKCFSQSSLPPIGQWREHLPYKSAIDVCLGNGKIFCATPLSFFTIDLAENSIERMSRITGLTGTGVSHICYDDVNDKFIIAYRNSNIDIIYRNDIFNVPDIKRKNISGDKAIYNIFSSGKYFYLSTGLGVIIIDEEKQEI